MCYWGWNTNMVIGRCWVGMEGHSSREWRIISRWTWVWKLPAIAGLFPESDMTPLALSSIMAFGERGWGGDWDALSQLFQLPIFYPSFNILISNMKWWEGHWERKKRQKGSKGKMKGREEGKKKEGLYICDLNPASKSWLCHWPPMILRQNVFLTVPNLMILLQEKGEDGNSQDGNLQDWPKEYVYK